MRRLTFIKALLTICLLLLVSNTLHAQTVSGRVKGVVLDQVTREAIPLASVVVIGSSRGAAADIDGRFIIDNLAPGVYHLRASAMGYNSDTQSEVLVQPNRSTEVEFLLEPSILKGEEVTVTTDFFEASPDLPTSSRTLSYEEVRRAPGAAEDVQRMIQALPGVAGANDQNNEIVVRGGSPYENLTVIDGIEVDNVNHFGYLGATGGPINALNPDFIQEVTFSSGGFSARYGDCGSSVLAIDLKEGNRENFRGDAVLSMAGIGLNLEGPFAKGQGSYLFSFRKSYLDFMYKAIGLTAIPKYWDTQFKGVYDLSSRHKLSVLGLYMDDRITIDAEEPDAWSRGAEAVKSVGYRWFGGARLRSLWKAGFSEFIIARTALGVEDDVEEMPERRLIYRDRVRQSTDQLSFSYSGKAIGRDEWSTGVIIKPIDFDYDWWLESDTVAYDDFTGDGRPDTIIYPPWVVKESAVSFKYGGFLQYRWRPSRSLSLMAGVRLDGFDYSEKYGVGPRTSLRWDFLPRWTFSLAYGVYYQAMPMLTYTADPDGGNRHLPHGHTDHYIAGITFLPRESTKLSFEAYYKDYKDLPVREEDLSDDPTFRSHIYLPEAEKQTWGLEFFAQQKLATNWYGTFSYSYGNAETSDPVRGTFPASYDFRHVSTLIFGYKTNVSHRKWFQTFERRWYGWWTHVLPVSGDELTASTRFRYVSGRPYTPRIWTTDGLEYDYHWEDGFVNANRYPDYSRWDVRWDSKWFYRKRALIVFLEVQNVLDRPNVAEYFYADDGERDTAYQFRFFFVGGIRFEW
ncbi:TonB-dependent receptor [bacterium]|nr:TonB-dependent receptor [bacterium]